MKTEGATYKYVTLEEATKIMFHALSNWKIIYHYTRNPERAELDLRNPDNEDVMEIHFYKDMLDQISIYTDSDIVVYEVAYPVKEV